MPYVTISLNWKTKFRVAKCLQALNTMERMRTHKRCKKKKKKKSPELLPVFQSN